MIRSQNEIYERLYAVFESNAEPLTCVDLMDMPSIRDAATARWGNDIQHVGLHVAKGDSRSPHRTSYPTNKARWAYTKRDAKPEAAPIRYEPKVGTKNKGTLEIVERDGEVVLNFAQFTIVIKPK